jgi:hypothetical protein
LSLKYSRGKYISDTLTKALVLSNNSSVFLYNDHLLDRFLHTYDSWIKSTKNNDIVGLDNFAHKCYSLGTTESFNVFYMRNNTKRLRCFKNEYKYHSIVWANNFNHAFIEDCPLATGDALVLSIPFADSGNEHFYKYMLQKCCELDIPVLIDCCWFGTCSNIVFDFNYSCITDIVFSLSKTFPISHARVGMRYTRTKYLDGLQSYNDAGMINRVGAGLGLSLINTFTSDYIYDKYNYNQKKICEELKVTASNVVSLAIGGSDWSHLNRGGFYNRLCIADDLCNN